MKRLFKEKGSKFGSLISLIAVTAMLALYSLALPELLASVSGRFFAAAWAVMAILIFVAHARRMADPGRRHLLYWGHNKDGRSKKLVERSQRFTRLRG